MKDLSCFHITSCKINYDKNKDIFGRIYTLLHVVKFLNKYSIMSRSGITVIPLFWFFFHSVIDTEGPHVNFIMRVIYLNLNYCIIHRIFFSLVPKFDFSFTRRGLIND